MIPNHDNFNSMIANRYGAECLETVKKFAKLRTKRKKLECGLEYVVKCRDRNVIPKFARIKPVKCFRDYEAFFHAANMRVVRRIIADYRRKLAHINNTLYGLHLRLSHLLHGEMWELLDAMSYSRSNTIELLTKKTHEKKLNCLIRNQNYDANRHNESNIRASVDLSNNVINLSSLQLSDIDVSVLSRGLNFAPVPRKVPNECIIASIEDSIMRNKIPYHDAECIRQDVSTMLRKAKLPPQNISREEKLALSDLRDNKSILVLPADKGNATVIVNTEDYELKIAQLLSDENTYKKVSYNPTPRVTTKVIKLLQSSGDDEMLKRLRPHNPTTPKIYGLPKIHKPNWPLRPIVSQIDAPTYKLSRHLASILQPLTGKSGSYVKDSRHFIQLISDIRLEPSEIMVSFDVSSLFTNVPVEDAMGVIANLVTTAGLPAIYIEWTNYCLRSGYFVWRGDHFIQVDGVAMGSPIAPVVANIFMEHFERQAIRTAPIKPRYWWRYVDDVFAIVTENGLTDFLDHLNSVHPKIQFTTERETGGTLPFLDVRVTRDPGGGLSHSVYRKPTHTDRYLRADSHHHPSHLMSVPRTLINRALALCDQQHVQSELDHVRKVLEGNGYSWSKCSRMMHVDERRRTPTVERSPVYLPFIHGITDKVGYFLRRKYNIKPIFRPPSQIRQYLRSPKDSDPLSVPGVYNIPCDCGKSYIGETRRNIATRLTEHIRSVKNLDTIKSAVAEHALTQASVHYIRFDKTSVLAREKFFVPRKIREAIEINRLPNFNRDQGWGISPSWRPLLKAATADLGSVQFCLESDTVSAVCTQPYVADVCDEERVCASPPPPAPVQSSRAQRAERRGLVSSRLTTVERGRGRCS